MINKWAEESTLYVYGGSHLYVFQSEVGGKEHASDLTLEEIRILPHSEFSGPDYMYPTNLGWRGIDDLFNNIYFFLLQKVSKDAIEFAYGQSYSSRPPLGQKVMAS